MLVRFNIQMSSTASQKRPSLCRIASLLTTSYATRAMRRDLLRGVKQGENYGDGKVAFPKPPGQRRLNR